MDTTTITPNQYQDLQLRITRLEHVIAHVFTRQSPSEVEPQHGTPEWWDWSHKQAMIDITKGDIKNATSDEDINQLLNL